MQLHPTPKWVTLFFTITKWWHSASDKKRWSRAQNHLPSSWSVVVHQELIDFIHPLIQSPIQIRSNYHPYLSNLFLLNEHLPYSSIGLGVISLRISRCYYAATQSPEAVACKCFFPNLIHKFINSILRLLIKNLTLITNLDQTKPSQQLTTELHLYSWRSSTRGRTGENNHKNKIYRKWRNK